MFGSDILDAAIGLLLVYFLFSMLCSLLNEWFIAHVTNARASMLEHAIRQMLASPNPASAPTPGSPAPAGKSSPSFADRFFDHPLITALTDESEKKPSYIPSSTFVDGLFAVVEEISRENSQNGKIGNKLTDLQNALNNIAPGFKETHRVIHSMVGTANNLAEARKRLEDWFDGSMERVSGAYKRKTRIWVLLWAIVVTAVFNVDSIEITRHLVNDPKLRATLVAMAPEVVKEYGSNLTANATSTNLTASRAVSKVDAPPGSVINSNSGALPPHSQSGGTNLTNGASSGGTDAPLSKAAEDLYTPKKLVDQINQLNIPIGWKTLPAPDEWYLKVIGLLATVGALSLGAPFWFDLLSKLVNLRATGKKPQTAEEKEEKENKPAGTSAS